MFLKARALLDDKSTNVTLELLTKGVPFLGLTRKEPKLTSGLGARKEPGLGAEPHISHATNSAMALFFEKVDLMLDREVGK